LKFNIIHDIIYNMKDPMRFLDRYIRRGATVNNPGQPVLLTFEPAGDGEHDIAWAARGDFRDLGRYALCPHLGKVINLLNESLRTNDGIGMGGEAVLSDLNKAMIENRYRLGACAVKPFAAILEGVTEYQAARQS
jgi:hypothetical protein